MNTQLEFSRQSFIFCHITTQTWNLFALFAIVICTGQKKINIPDGDSSFLLPFDSSFQNLQMKENYFN